MSKRKSGRSSIRRTRDGGRITARATPDPRVISLKQPWAWAVASGRKKIENRNWSTRYRGPVYIHASTKLDRAAIEWLNSEMRVKTPEEFVQGAIVAVAVIEDVVTKRDAARFGKWFSGRYGFVLSHVRTLPRAVATKGRLGLVRASGALQARVERAVKDRKPRKTRS